MKGPRYLELVRVSSVGQAQADSPEDQRRALDALRRSRPGTLVERIDSTVSGAKDSDDRADLRRLFDLAARRAFDEVRVRHVDRLTRHPDPRQRAAIFGALTDAGAVVVEATGRVIDPADEMGELDLSLQGWMASRERKRILERTLAAKRRIASEGRLASGRQCVPWGRAYDRARGWSLTDAAEDYRRLFDLVLGGATLWQAARTLTEEGVTSPRGRPWTGPMVGNLLRAPHASGRWRSYGHDLTIPAVVDERTQAAALAQLRAHDNCGGAHVRHEALIRKIGVCGVCGSPLHTNRNTSRYAQPYYHCSARDPRCYRPIGIALVDDAVKARLLAWASKPGPLELGGDAPAEDPERAIKAAQRALDKAIGEERALLRAAAAGSWSEQAIRAETEAVRARRAAAERRVEDARSRARFAARSAERAQALEQATERLRSALGATTFAEWRALVDLLFPRDAGCAIRLWPDGRLRLEAILPLGDASPRSRMPCSVPVTLEARVL